MPHSLASLWVPVLLFAQLGALPRIISAEEDYDYGPERGPATWPSRFPRFCSGRRQSPINIGWNQVYPNFEENPIKFVGYDVPQDSMILTNNGHTAEVAVVSKQQPYLENGPLKDRYILEQFHFHWGAASNRGSEHTLDGYRFPMEMHLVHWNEKYGSFENAREVSDGLAVVAIFFEINNYSTRLIDEVTTHLPEVRDAENSTRLRPIPVLTEQDSVGRFYPYFYYDGSLTTPNCSETVQWIVYPRPLPVTESQMRRFRQLRATRGEPLVDNFRPVQPLNGRRVYYTLPL